MSQRSERRHDRVPEAIVEYTDVHQDSDGIWHARRKPRINDEQRAHGVKEEISADTFDDLFLKCCAQRVLAAWYS